MTATEIVLTILSAGLLALYLLERWLARSWELLANDAIAQLREVARAAVAPHEACEDWKRIARREAVRTRYWRAKCEELERHVAEVPREGN